MLREIGRAEHSIYIEMYIMIDDTRGGEFIELLSQKAGSGVRVKLVLDSFGSFSLSGSAIEMLRASGVEVLFFSRWLHRLHRKLLIVDERIAITGGVNIHRGAEGWADLALRLEGRHTVRTALHLFAKTYFMAGGKDPYLHQFLQANLFRKLKTSFLHYGPHEKKKTLKRLYKEKLFEAKRSIMIVTPYFAPDRWLIGALDAAVLRGVVVAIVVPQLSDSWFMDRANRFYMQKMTKTNVQFFLFPKMNHAKVFVIDEREALVGSQNLDALSFNRNIESGVMIENQDIVRDISMIVEKWKSESERFQKARYARQWYDYVLAPIIRLLQPFL